MLRIEHLLRAESPLREAGCAEDGGVDEGAGKNDQLLATREEDERAEDGSVDLDGRRDVREDVGEASGAASALVTTGADSRNNALHQTALLPSAWDREHAGPEDNRVPIAGLDQTLLHEPLRLGVRHERAL